MAQDWATVRGCRVNLCTSMIAAGCTMPQVQAALRWASPEALDKYNVTQASEFASWLFALARGAHKRWTERLKGHK